MRLSKQHCCGLGLAVLGKILLAGMALACSSSEVAFQGIVWSPGGGALTAVCCALALDALLL